jgi:hypothetical protein
MGANLLPVLCGKTVVSPDDGLSPDVSPIADFDWELEKVTRGLNLRMLAPRLNEVACRREGAKQASDRYESKRVGAVTGRITSTNLTPY